MPYKICQVCAVPFTFEKFLQPLCSTLHSSGYEVHVASSFSGDISNYDQRLFYHSVSIRRSASILALFNSTRYLVRLFLAERFHLVHVHTPVASIACRIAGFLTRTPIVIYTAHGFYFHDEMPFLTRSFHISIEWILSKLTTYLFTQSSEDAEFAISRGFLPSSHVLAIGNGVDILRFNVSTPSKQAAARSFFGLHHESIVIGIVARQVQEKGYLELFDAFRNLISIYPSIQLLICGAKLDSDHDASIQPQITQLAADFPGSVFNVGLLANVELVYQALDVFCLPSWREGMPRTIIEAMMSGLPVVATNIRGCREEVDPDVTGLLVPTKSPLMLANALLQLIDSTELRNRLGSAGRERAEKLYDEALVIKRQLAVYQRYLPV